MIQTMSRINKIKERIEAIKPWAKPYPIKVSSPMYSRSEKSRWDREAQDFRYEIARLEKELKELVSLELEELRHAAELRKDNNEVLTIRPRGDVDRENAELRKDKELAELKVENALLRQDKERLDWMLREYNICRFGYQRLTRDDIDEAMKGESL